ncbi:hypothetical protein UFOVP1666_54 [uncultured Caudovirales phage]|uniref:Major tropism determinant N-terminal domain-containing protein n=1 Tax=uncultured Caudovirales phage TaxID=2100421 RepID=A0A6J5PMA7_9CAUD|nr:hypothetical protein UFOVP867_9 [uncultured Caudovirales phage]CAB4171106.1 hypothetical protein UFOVP913_189 [uncultured Caudovirales phage]CAB4176632.1 hypothetical protein UFOVP993_45 [uncultured Caudovirales phage]CAB4223011.1 hypothetical protein UFOVP1666_54 [uncultured Caudovirales phage]
MAAIVRIKRSTTQGDPALLGSGELAYSSLGGTQNNGGDRVYIGVGAETAGNANTHHIIGGKYFTDLMDHVHGTVTASSALIVDSSSKLDILNVDNLTLNGNTISSTNSNGNITLDPVGSGYVEIVGTNALIIPVGTTGQRAPGTTGAIRYNSDSAQFEGYAASDWSSLGGVRSVDGQTYIIAETTPGNSDDTLHFYAGTGVSTNIKVATLDSTVLAILPTTVSSSTITGALTVAGGVGIAGNLWIGGDLHIGGTGVSIGGVTFDQGLTLSGSNTAATEYFIIQNASAVNKFVVDTANGNTVISGTLEVVGHATLEGVTSTGATGTGKLVFDGSPTLVTPNLGTPSTLVGTNITGTATSFTASNVTTNANLTGMVTSVGNATTVVTNANLTGVITSVGNATSIASQTGTGTKFVVDNTPTLITPVLGVATATSINKVTITTPGTGSTLTLVDGSTLATAGAYVTTITSTGTTGVTLPTTGTLATLAGGETLTNKTLSTSSTWQGNTVAVVYGGTGTATGSITGTAALTFTAAAGDNNINLVPTGTGTVDVGTKRITGVKEPEQPQDAATKHYVDHVAQGLHVHQPVALATTGTLTSLTSGGTVTYDNGTLGVGATLTLQNALTSLDTISLTNDMRILVKNEANQTHNGVYTWVTGGTVLTRVNDMDIAEDVAGGDFMFVVSGSVNGDTGWVQTQVVTTMGTDPIIFAQFSGAGTYLAGDGLTIDGSTFNVGGTTNRISVSSDAVDISASYVGQSSITTLGTIGTGIWNGAIVGGTYGGTGINNGASTITIGGNISTAGAFTTSGAYGTTLTATNTTSVTLPTTGTLATLAGSETLSSKTITGSSIGTSSPSTAAFTTLTSSGATTFTSATDSSSLITGAVILTGGMAVNKTIYVGDDIIGAGPGTLAVPISVIDGFQIDGGTY